MRLSGSSFERARRCPRSAVTPDVVVERDDSATEARTRGSAIHRFLALVHQVGREAALELLEPALRPWCAALDVEALPHADPEAWAVEVALAWNVETGEARELARGVGERPYAGIEYPWIPGTLDLLSLVEREDGGTTVLVPDVKSGWRPLGRPEDSLQLKFYAAAAAAAYGADAAQVSWLRLTDGEPRWEHGWLDELDLSAAAEELRAVVAAVREAGPDSPPAPGPWCTYCPAYLRCPAQATLLRELLPVSAEQVPTLSAEQLPALYERLVLVESVVEAARKAVDTLARSNPIRLPDGRVYGLREEVHETLDPDVTERVLSELWGPEYAAKAVRAEKVATGAALEDAARARAEKLTAEAKAATLGGKARRVTVSSQEEAARAAIRAAGGARQRVVARLRAFRP